MGEVVGGGAADDAAAYERGLDRYMRVLEAGVVQTYDYYVLRFGGRHAARGGEV